MSSPAAVARIEERGRLLYEKGGGGGRRGEGEWNEGEGGLWVASSLVRGLYCDTHARDQSCRVIWRYGRLFFWIAFFVAFLLVMVEE